MSQHAHTQHADNSALLDAIGKFSLGHPIATDLDMLQMLIESAKTNMTNCASEDSAIKEAADAIKEAADAVFAAAEVVVGMDHDPLEVQKFLEDAQSSVERAYEQQARAVA